MFDMRDTLFTHAYCPLCNEHGREGMSRITNQISLEGFFRECSTCKNENNKPILKKLHCQYCEMIVCVKHYARHISRWHKQSKYSCKKCSKRSRAMLENDDTAMAATTHNPTLSMDNIKRDEHDRECAFIVQLNQDLGKPCKRSKFCCIEELYAEPELQNSIILQ